MKRQISNDSRWHQISLKCLLCLACLLLFMEGSIAQPLTQQGLLDTCSGLRTQEALEADSFVDLMCDASGSPIIDNITWALQRIDDSQATPLMITAPKYTTDFNRLRVHDTATTDDGLYSCRFTFMGDTEETIRNAGCIYVLGTAKYATCSDHTSPCSETVPTVMSPGDFVLNVTIDFYLQGSSGFTQRIHRLNLFNSSDQAIYTCSNESESSGVPCADNGRIIVEGSRSHKYDITLRFTNSVPEDSGTYTAVVEVENPHTSGRSDLTKTFMVNVTSIVTPAPTEPATPPSSPSSPSSTSPTSLPPQSSPTTTGPSMSPTSSTSSNSDPSPSDGQSTQSENTTTLIAVVVPLSIIFIILVISVVVVLLLVTRRGMDITRIFTHSATFSSKEFRHTEEFYRVTETSGAETSFKRQSFVETETDVDLNQEKNSEVKFV